MQPWNESKKYVIDYYFKRIHFVSRFLLMDIISQYQGLNNKLFPFLFLWNRHSISRKRGELEKWLFVFNMSFKLETLDIKFIIIFSMSFINGCQLKFTPDDIISESRSIERLRVGSLVAWWRIYRKSNLNSKFMLK